MTDHLNQEALLELKMIMGEEFPQLLDTFRRDSVQRIAAIREAVVAADADAIRRTAHSFKGSAGNMGATELNELCRQLEELGSNGETAGSDTLLEAIVSEYQEVDRALDAI